MNTCISDADCGTGNNPIWKKWRECQWDEERVFHLKPFSILFFPAVSIGFLCQFPQLVFKHLPLSQECHHQLGLVPEADVVSVVEPAFLLPDQPCSLLHHSRVILHRYKIARKEVPGQQRKQFRSCEFSLFHYFPATKFCQLTPCLFSNCGIEMYLWMFF